MTFQRFDYLVVGSGLAGLTFALRASEHGSVCVLTKADITDSNTNLAQGGIAAAVGEADDWHLHEKDTLIAGAGLCDPAAVRFLVRQAPTAIDWLRGLGARFDLQLGREGGHSRNRIVHHADKTGWEVERVVSDAVRRNPKITVYENAFVTRLISGPNLHLIDPATSPGPKEEGAPERVAGLTAHVPDLGLIGLLGKATMLATGGAGMLYSHTTNPRVATADGIGLAEDVGADIRDMEFMQFHPTVLYNQQLKGFLITEAVRGAGGTLRNHTGSRFMYDHDARLELAPRDIVARSIEREMQRLKTWCVYLDTTHLDPHHLQEEFPTIWEKLREVGIKMERDWIPVTPAQHYSCGGVVTDLDGRTSVAGLYASGEIARTGVHGANRLASNSLLEAIVFATAAARAVQADPEVVGELSAPEQPKCVAEIDAVRIRHALQNCMSENVAVFRTNEGLNRAKRKIEELVAEYAKLPKAPYSQYCLETLNLLVAGKIVVDGALERKSNVGLHYNADLESATPSTSEAKKLEATAEPSPSV